MNRFRIKMAGLVILILAVIIGVHFWLLGESPPSAQLQEQDEVALKPQQQRPPQSSICQKQCLSGEFV